MYVQFTSCLYWACDPIAFVAKNADMAIRHQKVVIQDAKDFYAWAKNSN